MKGLRSSWWTQNQKHLSHLNFLFFCLKRYVSTQDKGRKNWNPLRETIEVQQIFGGFFFFQCLRPRRKLKCWSSISEAKIQKARFESFRKHDKHTLESQKLRHTQTNNIDVEKTLDLLPRKKTCPLKKDYFNRKCHLPTMYFQGTC